MIALIEPESHDDPDRHHTSVRVTKAGVEVRTEKTGGVELLTTEQAREILQQVRWAGWRVGTSGGGAELSAKPFECCVVIRCMGAANAAELEAFAGELEVAIASALVWIPPESLMAKRWKKRKQRQAARA